MAANEVVVTINLGDLMQVKGQLETMMIVVGLMAEKYPQHLIGQFIEECVELKQYDELNLKKQQGAAYMDAVIGDRFGDLADLLAAKEKENQLQQHPDLQTWKDGDPEITGTVEIVDKLPEEAQAPARKTAAKAPVKTAAKAQAKTAANVTAKAPAKTAAKATAKKTTARKKASGAADEK